MKLMDKLLELMNSKKKIGCWDLVEVYREYFTVLYLSEDGVAREKK